MKKLVMHALCAAMLFQSFTAAAVDWKGWEGVKASIGEYVQNHPTLCKWGGAALLGAFGIAWACKRVRQTEFIPVPLKTGDIDLSEMGHFKIQKPDEQSGIPEQKQEISVPAKLVQPQPAQSLAMPQAPVVSEPEVPAAPLVQVLPVRPPVQAEEQVQVAPVNPGKEEAKVVVYPRAGLFKQQSTKQWTVKKFNTDDKKFNEDNYVRRVFINDDKVQYEWLQHVAGSYIEFKGRITFTIDEDGRVGYSAGCLNTYFNYGFIQKDKKKLMDGPEYRYFVQAIYEDLVASLWVEDKEFQYSKHNRALLQGILGNEVTPSGLTKSDKNFKEWFSKFTGTTVLNDLLKDECKTIIEKPVFAIIQEKEKTTYFIRAYQTLPRGFSFELYRLNNLNVVEKFILRLAFVWDENLQCYILDPQRKNRSTEIFDVAAGLVPSPFFYELIINFFKNKFHSNQQEKYLADLSNKDYKKIGIALGLKNPGILD